MTMHMRLFAKFEHPYAPAKVKHSVGLPPELTGGTDNRRQLAGPAFLLVEERVDGVFLFRYDAQGQCVGDTWHLSVQDAKDQAKFEYPDASLDWHEVPPDVADAVQFGMTQLG